MHARSASRHPQLLPGGEAPAWAWRGACIHGHTCACAPGGLHRTHGLMLYALPCACVHACTCAYTQVVMYVHVWGAGVHLCRSPVCTWVHMYLHYTRVHVLYTLPCTCVYKIVHILCACVHLCRSHMCAWVHMCYIARVHTVYTLCVHMCYTRVRVCVRIHTPMHVLCVHICPHCTHACSAHTGRAVPRGPAASPPGACVRPEDVGCGHGHRIS